MFNFERALLRITFWQLVSRLSWNIISIALPLVTRFTKMSVTPTEPLGNWTAKFTFELNEICTMFIAVFDSTTNTHSRTFSAYQLFFFKCVIIIYLVTLFHSSKIRILTLKTHIIWQFIQCEGLKIIIKSRIDTFLCYLRIFMQIFKFSSFNSFCFYNFLECFLLNNFFM